MWLILAESDGLSDYADGLGSDAEALGLAAWLVQECYFSRISVPSSIRPFILQYLQGAIFLALRNVLCRLLLHRA